MAWPHCAIASFTVAVWFICWVFNHDMNLATQAFIYNCIASVCLSVLSLRQQQSSNSVTRSSQRGKPARGQRMFRPFIRGPIHLLSRCNLSFSLSGRAYSVFPIFQWCWSGYDDPSRPILSDCLVVDFLSAVDHSASYILVQSSTLSIHTLPG